MSLNQGITNATAAPRTTLELLESLTTQPPNTSATTSTATSTPTQPPAASDPATEPTAAPTDASTQHPNPWQVIPEGDHRALALLQQHQSLNQYRDHRPRKSARGQAWRLLLATTDGSALLVWRQSLPTDKQEGICCSLFRNQSAQLSSELLIQAEAPALELWAQTQRFYVFINPKLHQSPNPGYCFKQAGWQYAGRSPRGLHLLEKNLTPGR